MEESIDNIFEIRDSDINIKDIEKQIKENIIERKKMGAYSKDVENIVKQPLLPPVDVSCRDDHMSSCRDDHMSDINYINSNWNVHDIEYKISSHRPIIGRLLVWGRKLINGEVKRYVGLMIGRQSEFNKRTVSILSGFNNKIDDVNNKIDDVINKIDDVINKIDDVNNKINNKIDDVNNKINNKIDDVNNKIDKTDSKNSISSVDKIYGDMNYFVFNELFGGSNEEIKVNTEQFLDFFSGCKNVLDIGSGRGIFLELLKEKGIKGYGIDTNDDLISYCKRKDLNVQKDDVITHLKKLNNKSLDGIFISHIIEHLKHEDIIYMLKLCYEKMQYSSYIVIATPNILNMTVSSNTFYTDPTHITHVHPEFIKFLLRIYRFRDIQERFYQPTSKDQILKKIDNIESLGDEEKKIYDIMNYNIDILNNVLFGYRDYAIIAKK